MLKQLLIINLFAAFIFLCASAFFQIELPYGEVTFYIQLCILYNLALLGLLYYWNKE